MTTPYRLIVAGSRSFADYPFMVERLDHYTQSRPDLLILSGTAAGADRLGERYALTHDHQLQLWPADWDRFGRSAGYRRNADMAAHADALVVFWDGQSRGTSHMIDLGRSAGLAVRVVHYEA